MQQEQTSEFQDHNHPKHFIGLLSEDYDTGLPKELNEALQYETRDGELRTALLHSRTSFHLNYLEQPPQNVVELAALETKIGTRVSWKIESITLDEICAMKQLNTNSLQDFSDYTRFAPYREHFSLYNPEARSIVDITNIGVLRLEEDDPAIPESDILLLEYCDVTAKRSEDIFAWLQNEFVDGKPKVVRKCGWWAL